MATRIIEFSEAGLRGDAYPYVPAHYFVAKQSAMTATGSSAQSSAVNAATRLVCVQSDEAISVEINANPTATADSYRLQAGGEQFFSVENNASWKVAIKL